ncbi:hypothetical protein HK102_003161, partial [Quaeritorhiza haematococci]
VNALNASRAAGAGGSLGDLIRRYGIETGNGRRDGNAEDEDDANTTPIRQLSIPTIHINFPFAPSSTTSTNPSPPTSASPQSQYVPSSSSLPASPHGTNNSSSGNVDANRGAANSVARPENQGGPFAAWGASPAGPRDSMQW